MPEIKNVQWEQCPDGSLDISFFLKLIQKRRKKNRNVLRWEMLSIKVLKRLDCIVETFIACDVAHSEKECDEIYTAVARGAKKCPVCTRENK